MHSKKPDKSVVNDIISSISPFFLRADSPLNVQVKTYITDCFQKFGSLKVIPPDDVRKLEAHTTIMSIFDCMSNSHWHGIIESVLCVYMENVALGKKLNLAVSFLWTNLPAPGITKRQFKFHYISIFSRKPNLPQQFLRLQLCKRLCH
jgi:hypothetical protein